MMIAARQIVFGGEKKSPTARDYVQDGLIAMWDGIENAGWGKHDPNTTVWKDLTLNGYNMTVTKNGAFDSNAFISLLGRGRLQLFR